MKTEVFVLKIDHRHGSNVTVHGTRDDARRELLEYVGEEWGDRANTEAPDDFTQLSPDDRIEAYFGDNELEFYEIERTEYTPADYQGWTNHATWCVALHLDNTQSLHLERRARVREAMEAAKAEIEADKDPLWTLEQAEIYHAAEALKEFTSELLDPVASNSTPEELLARDLLNGYLDDVNWREIARHDIDTLKQDES